MLCIELAFILVYNSKEKRNLYAPCSITCRCTAECSRSYERKNISVGIVFGTESGIRFSFDSCLYVPELEHSLASCKCVNATDIELLVQDL